MLKTTFNDLASRSASGKTIDKETFLKYTHTPRHGQKNARGKEIYCTRTHVIRLLNFLFLAPPLLFSLFPPCGTDFLALFPAC